MSLLTYIIVAWVSAIGGMGIMALLVAHGQREKQGEYIPVSREAEP